MTGQDTHIDRKRAERKRRLWRTALAICSAYKIPELIREEVAVEIAAAIRLVPRGKWQAAAHRIARRRLARDLGVPVRSVPVSRLRAGSIAQYEHTRRQREIWQRHDRKPWVGAFDYHSRWFAIENGVCPRCGDPGDFTPYGGACECGFSY